MLEIKRPMELAGLKSRLQRALRTEAAIEDTGKRYDRVLNDIDELHASTKSHVGQLELYKSDLAGTISRMTGGSNGGDPLSESDGQDSAGAKAPAPDPVKPVARPDITEIATADVAPMPKVAPDVVSAGETGLEKLRPEASAVAADTAEAPKYREAG